MRGLERVCVVAHAMWFAQCVDRWRGEVFCVQHEDRLVFVRFGCHSVKRHFNARITPSYVQ